MVTLQICLLKDPNHLETLWDCSGTVKWQHLKCLSLRSRRLTLKPKKNPVESMEFAKAGCFEDYLEITEAFGSSHGQRTCFTQQAWGFLAVKTRRNGYSLPPKMGVSNSPDRGLPTHHVADPMFRPGSTQRFWRSPAAGFPEPVEGDCGIRMRQGRRISGRGNLGMGQMG
jgi:hypothetical protein